MTGSERGRLLRDLFHRAMEMPKSARVEFVTRQAGEDASLRDEILALLEAAEDASTVASSSVGRERPAPAPDLEPRIYRILLGAPESEIEAELAALALSLGEKFRLTPLAAALQADVIAALKPSPGLQAYGRAFARAMISSAAAHDTCPR